MAKKKKVWAKAVALKIAEAYNNCAHQMLMGIRTVAEFIHHIIIIFYHILN